MDSPFHISQITQIPQLAVRLLPTIAVLVLSACGAVDSTPAPNKPIPVTIFAPTPLAKATRANSSAPTVAVNSPGPAVSPTSEIALIALASTPTPPAADNPAAAAGEAGQLAAQMLRLHNQLRAGIGRDDYAVSPALQVAAQRHADWLAAKGLDELARLGDAGHTGEGGSSIADRVAAAGYAAAASSENWSFGDLQSAFAFWSTDPFHSPQVLSSEFKEIGIGVAKHAGGSVVFVAVYAKPK